MKFLPYDEAGNTPNIIVDGAATTNTVVTLSHWPRSGCPEELLADTSTAIVYKYLETPSAHVAAEAVSNNHFDEDGLLGMFALLQPELGARHRPLCIDVAQAGDFGVFLSRQAARIAFTINALSKRATSTLPADIFALPYPQQTAALYVKLLDLMPDLLSDTARFKALWEPEDDRLEQTEELFARGLITIEEKPALDLAIVRISPHANRGSFDVLHRFAVHNRTLCTRLVIVQGRRLAFEYRYESWVQFMSRYPLPRVDLEPVVKLLNDCERSGGRWIFEGVSDITPCLRLEQAPESTVDINQVIRLLERELSYGKPAWQPYAEALQATL